MKTSNRRDFLHKATTAGASITAGLTASMLSPRSLQAQETSVFNRIIYRNLGSTGFKTSEIGMGCMNMRDPELVHAAIDCGINYLDTAHIYMNGQNEETIGKVMKTKRDKVFLTTKIGRRSTIDKFPEEIETSLKRLQTDHVDLLLIHHGGDTPEKVLNEGHMNVLDDARRKGQTRFVGYSTHTADLRCFEATIECKFYDAVLLCYNYQSPPSLTTSIEQLRKAGIGVIAMKNLLNFNTRPREPLEDIREDKDGPQTYAQALLKWVLANPYVDAIIPGMTSFEHLADDLAVMGMKLTFDDQRILRRYSENIKGRYCCGLSGCTGCRDKCPKGVEINEINRCLGYAYGYGDLDLAKENYLDLPRSNRIDICGDCDECAVKCVNGLNLTENIRSARKLFA